MDKEIVPLFLVGGVAVAAALWAASRASGGNLARDVGTTAGRAVVDAAEGAVVGTVTGIGEAVGIPQTDADQCTRDLAAGDLWAASFSCPAPRFIAAVAAGDYGPNFKGGGATGSW